MKIVGKLTAGRWVHYLRTLVEFLNKIYKQGSVSI